MDNTELEKTDEGTVDTYNPFSGTASKVANYVPEPDDNRSIMEKLADLSIHNPSAYDAAIDALITEKGEEWFKNLQFDWDINGRPKQFPPMPLEKWRAWVCLAGRGWGKDLNPLTPILTANRGWITLSIIEVGDTVFDEQGNKTKVTAIFDTNPEKCYRLHFSDGTVIEAGEGHQWVTWDRQDRKAYRRSSYEDANAFPDDWVNWKVKRKTARAWLNEEKVEEACSLFRQGLSVRQISKKTGLGRHALAKHIKNGGFLDKPTHEFEKNRIKTTQDLVDTLYHELSDGRLETNHCIPNTKPLNYPEQNLLIDPYIFGLWLGDGSKASGQIATHLDDLSNITKELDKLGYKYSEHKDCVFNVYGLVTELREVGVYKNKYIPDNYLRSSIDQRLSLLQGLMDSDGYVNKDGTQCEFSQSNEKLAKQVYELIISLGMSVHITSRTPTIDGVEKKENWRLRFSPNLPVFRLQRKLDRLNFSRTQILKRYSRYIVKAEEIEPIPMRCITVDSPNSMYLCGVQMLPTHNTKTGGNTVAMWVNQHKKGTKPIRIALVGATTSDVNGVMVGGDSGLLSNYPDKEKPEWVTTNRRVIWRYPDGEVKAIAELYSAEEPDRLRGPQFHYAWCDELAAWRYQEAWDMLMFGLRLGDNPQVIVTTTPRPYPILMDLLKLKTTWTTIGSTYENRSNLAPAFFDEIITKYEGSPLGRQELMAELVEEVPNAMWNWSNIEKNRIKYDDLGKLPEMLSMILAIDPATTNRSSSAETGMCIAGYGEDDHFYIFHLDAVKMSPDKWAARAIRLFEQYKCDKMIAEVNNGGDLVEAVIKAKNPLQKVYAVHASRGKTTRAEPIAALYEQNRVHHIGNFVEGEKQMTAFNPLENPYGLKDMVDALVWAMTWLVDTTQGKNSYKPAVGAPRTKLNTYKNIFGT